MTILAPTAAVVKFDSAAIVPAARPFGFGILRKPAGPSAADIAFEAGRSIALECEGPVEAPAHYTLAERSAFLAGLAEGAAVAHAREVEHLNDLAMQVDADAVMESGIPCW